MSEATPSRKAILHRIEMVVRQWDQLIKQHKLLCRLIKSRSCKMLTLKHDPKEPFIANFCLEFFGQDRNVLSTPHRMGTDTKTVFTIRLNALFPIQCSPVNYIFIYTYNVFIYITFSLFLGLSVFLVLLLFLSSSLK